MYTVQAETVTYPPSITCLPTELYEPEWTDLVTIPQLGSEQEELTEARKVVQQCTRHYANVRILKYLPGGARKVVR